MDNVQKATSVRDLLEWGSDFLKKEGIESPRRSAEQILGHLLRLNRINLYLSEKESLDPLKACDYERLLQKRARRVPLQYVLGKVAFLDDEFLIDERVLIPRPETELLVEEAVKRLSKVADPLIIDIGTGCGNIAISLAKKLNTRVWATDVSQDALEVAKKNADRLGVQNQITFLHGDLFVPLAGLGIEGRIDLVISNPPYVPTKEWARLSPEVRLFEPRIALDGGEDGLLFYRRIVANAVPFLKEGGYLILELGDRLAEAVASLIRAQALLSEPEILEDLAGIKRILAARRRKGTDDRSQTR